MKRLLSLLFLVLCMGMTSVFATTPTVSETTQTPSSIKKLSVDLEGTIGGSDGSISIYDGKGSFSVGYAGEYYNLKVTQFDARTGKLIFNAYYKNGKYFGRFVGKVIKDPNNHVKGVLTTTKGRKINFDLNHATC